MTEHQKYITVPINQKGIDEYSHMDFETENLLSFVLPEDEYEKLDRHHVFDIINTKCGKMIDVFESEKVSADDLKSVYRDISPIKGIWLDAVNKALEYNTCICLDF